MSDDRYNPKKSHIQNANSARANASKLQFSYDTDKLKKENRYRVQGQAFPKTINGFNWGACLLTPLWGLCNNTPVACLWIVFAFIPVIGVILTSIFSLYCGLKGNEWAWANNDWQSIDHMHYIQKKWATAGVIVEIIAILAFCVYAMQHINSLQRAGIL